MNLLRQKYAILRKIFRLKQNLSHTDYHALKFSDGALTEEEYAPIRAERQSWRDEINRLEEEIKDINERSSQT